jgi:hypothetical protein
MSFQSGEPLPFEGLERQALRQSLDPASARERVAVGGEQVGLSRATRLIPESSLGAGAEQEEGEWKVGLTSEFPIPLFDQGQGRIGHAAAERKSPTVDIFNNYPRWSEMLTPEEQAFLHMCFDPNYHRKESGDKKKPYASPLVIYASHGPRSD